MADIDRRDFLNGTAIALTAGAIASSGPARAAAKLLSGPADPLYPPALTGLRGSHAGSYEVAHSMSWDGARYGKAETRVDDRYDLVVVGGGLSGLAAARFFQQKKGPDARILILDNHDDFGGHAKRNEFNVDGHLMVGYGGSQSIDTPSSYSDEAKGLLEDIGVTTDRFYDYYDRDFNRNHGLDFGIFFDKAHYGTDKITRCPSSLYGLIGLGFGLEPTKDGVIDDMPLSPEARKALHRLVGLKKDLLPGLSEKAKLQKLGTMSYSQFLRDYAEMPDEVVTLMARTLAPLEALSWDNVPASEAASFVFPGTRGLGLEGSSLLPLVSASRRFMPHRTWRSIVDRVMDMAGAEPYIFHFPDGNAGVARLLVRKLMPHVAPGSTMEDIVKAEVDYEGLDRPDRPVRIRLNSTVVDVSHWEGGAGVDVSYVLNGKSERVEAKRVVLACNHKIIPYICRELPEVQRQAMDQAERAPLAYINVALRNWQAFKKAGVARIYAPQAMFSSMALDFPVSMGGVQYPQSPDEPMLMHISYTPSAHLQSTEGRSAREVFKEGKHWLYVMSFDDFEIGIKAQMNAMLGAHGFDAERDIAAITVNRWPHGYAYYPLSLWDEVDEKDPRSPNQIARKRHGRISIANSDAEYKAYVNGAFDAAWRAVEEQVG